MLFLIVKKSEKDVFDMKGKEKKRKKKSELWKDLLKKKFPGWQPNLGRKPASQLKTIA